MTLTREELLSALFRETDRAQRTKMPLALVKVGITSGQRDPADVAVPPLGSAIFEMIERISPLLRCYDVVGQMADCEFLLVLPGCRTFNARSLAERLRDHVLNVSTHDGARETQFHSYFGIASSGGRSPFVILREVDAVLQRAKAEGPGSIQCIAAKEETDDTYLLPTYQNEAQPW